MNKYINCVIFGGKGYIGSFFAAYLLDLKLAKTIYLVDISEHKRNIWPSIIEDAVNDGRVILVNGDVRKTIDNIELPEKCDLICNFAAVHREPGHLDEEYFETNLLGAENVCVWADKVSCKYMIFTSSIAPYGTIDREKREDTLPVPVTAYGSSKLVAEKIHIAWQNRDIDNRFLSIVRPGVIYGPGEDGNVPRMIHAVIKRYFFYMGNQDTRKAGGYIKELVFAMQWVVNNQVKKSEGVVLYNFTSKVAPTIREYVTTIGEVVGEVKHIPNVPFWVLLFISNFIEIFAKPFGIKHPFSPVRIRKLVKSNDIIPTYLIDNNYPFQFDLKASFLDWKESSPKDWLHK